MGGVCYAAAVWSLALASSSGEGKLIPEDGSTETQVIVHFAGARSILGYGNAGVPLAFIHVGPLQVDNAASAPQQFVVPGAVRPMSQECAPESPISIVGTL